ncbi:MAG: hypothetical protein AB1486_05310 [Planctomycetota bacterium]
MWATRASWALGAALLALLSGGILLAYSVRQPAENLSPLNEVALPSRISTERSAVPSESVPSSALRAFGRLPPAFVENRGQLNEQVAFTTQAGAL